MSERLAGRYGKYRLVAGQAGDGYVVRAYLGARLLHEEYGPALDGAAAEARWWLDQHEREIRAQRRNGRPAVEEYRRALVLVPFGADHEAMLRAHARAPGRTITAAELAAALGHADAEAAAREYSRLGRRIAEFIGFTPPGPTQRGEPLWIAAIATPGRYDEGSWSWVLFPEMVEALLALEPV